MSKQIVTGISETGEGTGACPFYSEPTSMIYMSTAQPVEDMEVDDPYSCSVAKSKTGIPETGEGTGTWPFSLSCMDPRQPGEGMKVDDLYSCSVAESEPDVVGLFPTPWREVSWTDTLLETGLLLDKGGGEGEEEDVYRDSRESRSGGKGKRRLQLLIENPFPYIKSGGPAELCQFTNTCVVDSLLAALHTTSIISSDLKDLFNKNTFFKQVMSLLNNKFYIKARKVFVEELNPGKCNLYGNVSDYFPLLHKLVYSDQKHLPNNSSIYNTILRPLKNRIEVIVLGETSDPALFLVHAVQGILNTELPRDVMDEKNRIFLLQFLLIGKDEHMTMCFHSSETTWCLYDNDPTKPSFHPFLLESLQNFIICLAGYITQVKEYKPCITESGEDVGTRPFYLDTSSSSCMGPGQHVEDWEMEDLCSCSLAVPESGEAPIHSEIVYS
ncbi:uncharacterized protein LOC124401213 [Silurus meridionalis]|uniref:Uncharacterized protein n=1 Tax=Silurus meridionalis TaxID=175797 RepID=A0A8T0AQK7_SILME|nr:uncharacterized protein LOC124401213 [Silurus meridionalis]KAF7694261.1 hypothetical protein HF521_008014 [Silurus meridionalis]